MTCNRKHFLKRIFYMFVECNGIQLFCHAERIDDPCILDLAFILDASGSIENDWDTVKNFVAGVVDLVNVSSAGTHVAVIKFGSESKIEFDFNEGQDKDAVISSVRNLAKPITGDNTQLDKALKLANDMLFDAVTNSHGFRTDENVRKVR